MKNIKQSIKKHIPRADLIKEDLRLLQKSISGRSVYKSLSKNYQRTPKYGKLEYEQYR